MRVDEDERVSAVAARLPDGRLHLQHGPIDLIIEAFGAADEVERAYGQAVERFGDILPTLVRRAAGPAPAGRRRLSAAAGPGGAPHGRSRVAASRRLHHADGGSRGRAWPTRCCRRWCAAAALDKAYVNDGGDIAIHLHAGP